MRTATTLRVHVLVGLALVVTVAPACTAPNPDLCEIDTDCPSGMVCGANQRCEPGTPDAVDAAGVDAAVDAAIDAMPECSANRSCTNPAAPVCDRGVCRGCMGHNECASGVCDVEAGTCTDAAGITYVSPSGSDQAGCGAQASPCRTINVALATGAPLIHVDPGTYLEAVVIDGHDTHLVGLGAEIVPPQAGAVLEIDNAAVILDGLTIRSATGEVGNGILCIGSAEARASVDIADATLSSNEAAGILSRHCDVTVVRSTITLNDREGITIGSNTSGDVVVRESTISGNGGDGVALGVGAAGSAVIRDATLRDNDRGAMSYGADVVILDSEISDNESLGAGVAGDGVLTVKRSSIRGSLVGLGLEGGGFEIVNNVVTGNGAGTAGSGISLTGGTSPAILLHNTIIDNNGEADTVGVRCSTGLATVVATENNIIWGNSVAIDDGGDKCTFRFSDIDATVLGEGNFSQDPKLADIAGGDFHLTEVSPCRNGADPESDVTEDIDGDKRPAEGRSDIGADELVP